MEKQEIKLTSKKIINGLLSIFIGLILTLSFFITGPLIGIVLFFLGLYLIYIGIMYFLASSQTILINASGISFTIKGKTYQLYKEEIKKTQISQYVRMDNPLYFILVLFAPGGETVISIEPKDSSFSQNINPSAAGAVSLILNSKNSKFSNEQKNSILLKIPVNQAENFDKKLQELLPESYIASFDKKETIQPTNN